MAKDGIPAYRIAALANLELGKHLEENPHELSEVQSVEWDVSKTDYRYVAKGEIRVPVELYFSKPDDSEEEPEVRRIIINGKREFDARLDEVDDGEDKDVPASYGVDEGAARAESFSRFKKGLSGK